MEATKARFASWAEQFLLRRERSIFLLGESASKTLGPQLLADLSRVLFARPVDPYDCATAGHAWQRLDGPIFWCRKCGEKNHVVL